MIWHTTVSKIVHQSLSKDMTGPMQIKRGKCYSFMLLSKNQLYKHKNQINKVPNISTLHSAFFPNISARHFTNVYNLLSCYHNGKIVICRLQGVTWRNNNKLFWEFFLNLFSLNVMIISLIEVNFYSSNFKKNKYNMGAFRYCYVEFKTPVRSNAVSKLS